MITKHQCLMNVQSNDARINAIHQLNSSPPGQNFRCIFVNAKWYIVIKNSLKFVPKCPIDNIPALVQIMDWRRIGDKPLSEPMLTRFTVAYMRH